MPTPPSSTPQTHVANQTPSGRPATRCATSNVAAARNHSADANPTTVRTSVNRAGSGGGGSGTRPGYAGPARTATRREDLPGEVKLG